jgi:hypothetical protein
VLECEQLYADAHHHGGARHRISAFHAFCPEWPYIFFGVSQYSSDVIVVPCCMNFTISTLPVPETVACHHLSERKRLFKLFRLIWLACVPPLLWLPSGFNTHERTPGFITWYSYNVIEKLISIFVYRSKKLKAEAIYAFCAHPWAFLEPILRKTCDSLA